MKVSLHALKAFESAARLGSFKKAAKELSITPTGVSHHVANLEERLGTRLFHRINRQVTLTAEGQRLSDATTQGFQVMQTGLDEITQDASRIRVETTSSFAALVLIPSLFEFHQRYPGLQVEVSTGESIGSPISQLSIRLGEARKLGGDRVDGHVLKVERFGLYGTASTLASMASGNVMLVYLTRWKNDRLPVPPWREWLLKSTMSSQAFEVRYFDQELYGVHEAMAGKGLVFCSQTLVASCVTAGTLTPVSDCRVDSDLCYYIPGHLGDYSLNIQALIEWLKARIS